MSCDKKVTADMLYDCADAPKRGIDGGKSVIINWDDIDWTATTIVGETITDLVLKSGTNGFSVEWYKDLASANSSFAPAVDQIDGFTHNFLTRLGASSAANAARANELKQGRFIMVYETRYKGAANVEAFKVAGIANGLKLTEMVNSTLENSGSTLYTLSTEAGDVEDYPYSIFLEVDYLTSKATFDSLFIQV